MDTVPTESIEHVIERHIYIAASTAEVWAALVVPEMASRYFVVPLLEADPRAGGRIVYGAPGQSQMTGTILECEPERRLVHTFALASLPEDPPSRVTYELEPIGDMTRLTMIHDGFPTRNATFNNVNGGWNWILSNLKTLLETGRTLPTPQHLRAPNM